jgi:hypothetical protein
MDCLFQVDARNGSSADGLRLRRGVIPGTIYRSNSGYVGTTMERQELQVNRNLAKSNVLVARKFDIARRLSEGSLVQSTSAAGATRTTASLAAPGT